MQEKQNKIKKEKEVDTEKMSNIVTEAKKEEETKKVEYLEQKKAEHRKWKETWETEIQFRKLQLTVENGARALQTKALKPFIAMSPKALPTNSLTLVNAITSGNLTSRAERSLQINNYNSPRNMFITAPTIEEYSTGKRDAA